MVGESHRFVYRKAVDEGRRSGGGKIVAMFYDLCNKLWASCPAVTSISNGNYMLFIAKLQTLCRCKFEKHGNLLPTYMHQFQEAAHTPN